MKKWRTYFILAAVAAAAAAVCMFGMRSPFQAWQRWYLHRRLFICGTPLQPDTRTLCGVRVCCACECWRRSRPHSVAHVDLAWFFIVLCRRIALPPHPSIPTNSDSHVALTSVQYHIVRFGGTHIIWFRLLPILYIFSQFFSLLVWMHKAHHVCGVGS